MADSIWGEQGWGEFLWGGTSVTKVLPPGLMLRLAETPEEIAALIAADALHIDFGAELLDPDDNFVADISEDLFGGEIDHDGLATVHGTCGLQLSLELDWANVRVRPYVVFTSVTHFARWYRGVFCPVAPEMQKGETPNTLAVDGYDKLSLLDRPVGDTYVVATGAKYLEAVQQVFTDAEIPGLGPLVDGTAGATTLPAPMVWLLDDSETTWLQVVNDLLRAINYRDLWVDSAGRFRCVPYQSPETAPPVWTFDLADPRTNLVYDSRRMTVDEYDRTNWWRFVQDGYANPTEGTGQYTVDESDGSPKCKHFEVLSVAGQTELEAVGDAIVAGAKHRKRTIEITTNPLPILEHLDAVLYNDGEMGGLLKCLVLDWNLPLDGDDMTITMEVVSP